MSTYLAAVDFYDELDAKYNLVVSLSGHGIILDFVRLEVLVSTINNVLYLGSRKIAYPYEGKRSNI